MTDYLSRAPTKSKDQVTDTSDRSSYLYFAEKVENWPINNNKIRKYTCQDPTLQEVKQYITSNKWPKDIETHIRPYYNRRSELHIENDVISWGYRVIIPQELRKMMLQELHANHMGMVKTKSLARSYLWWPQLDKHIEDIVNSCMPCLYNRVAPGKTTLTPWKLTTEPWSRIHIDYLGPIKRKQGFCKVWNTKSNSKR